MKISTDDIKKYLPHREPFLFVDEVIEIDKNNEIHVKKHINGNEFFLEGHFPDNPIFPGGYPAGQLGARSRGRL